MNKNDKLSIDGNTEFWGNAKKDTTRLSKSYDLTENVIRYAMKHTKSNMQAAIFLKVSINTYRKYASMYKDEVTGKTLYELHKNERGIGIKKGIYYGANNGKLSHIFSKRKITAKKILNGEFEHLKPATILQYLIKDNYVNPECDVCGFNSYRYTDKKYPLRLVFKDGDKTNRDRDNMEILCFNCYYLYIDDYRGRRDAYSKRKRKLGDIDKERQMKSGTNNPVIYDESYKYDYH